MITASPETGGRFISTHSVVLVLPMNIDALPERGGSIKAAAAMSRPGGGYTTLTAAKQLGAQAALVSPLGTGPNSAMIRQQLYSQGVKIITQELVGDIGVALQLLEKHGEITSIVTAGVESEPSRAFLDSVVLQPGDLVYISGVDLAVPLAAEALAGWGEALPSSVRLVVSVAPAVHQVPMEAWIRLLRRADVLTMNLRESNVLQSRISQEYPGKGIRDLMRKDAAIVRRLGARGSEVQTHKDSETQFIPAYQTQTVDTAGVGDTHIGTMCAAWLETGDIAEACRWANAAAAITISHESALPVPTREQVITVMMTGSVGS